MAEASRIQTEVMETRRKAMIASDAKVKSDMRVAELEKRLEIRVTENMVIFESPSREK